MKNFFLLVSVCLIAAPALEAQTKIDTLDFKTGMNRILGDYANGFENLKAEDTCKYYCKMNIVIPDLPDMAVNNIGYDNYCTLVHSHLGPKADKADSTGVEVMLAGMKTTLKDVAVKLFGKMVGEETECKIEDIDRCRDYVLRPKKVKAGDSYLRISMKTTQTFSEDGLKIFWYTTIMLTKERWTE